MFGLHDDDGQGAFRFVGAAVTEYPRHGGGWFERQRGGGGWYTDPYGDVMKDGGGLCWGVVYQVPARDGRARFVAGYEFGGVDSGVTLDLSRVWTAEDRGDAWNVDPKDFKAAQEAARHANQLAERAAQEERDWQSAWRAGVEWTEKGAEISALRRATIPLIAELRDARRSFADAAPSQRFSRLCDAVRAQVSRVTQRIAELREDRARLARGDGDGGREDFLTFYPDARLRDAFNDGAGCAAIPAA